jgi:hypothetical protein
MADLDPSLFSRRSIRETLIAAGATEQTRSRRPTNRPTRLVDQFASADTSLKAFAASRRDLKDPMRMPLGATASLAITLPEAYSFFLSLPGLDDLRLALPLVTAGLRISASGGPRIAHLPARYCLSEGPRIERAGSVVG